MTDKSEKQDADTGEPVSSHWFCHRCVMTLQCYFETWGYIPESPPCPVCGSELQMMEHPPPNIDRKFCWRRPKTREEADRCCLSESDRRSHIEYLAQGGLVLDHPDNASSALDAGGFESEKERISKVLEKYENNGHDPQQILSDLNSN